jgi:hypothetical protein
MKTEKKKVNLNKRNSEKENFNEWMCNRVKSIYYSNNLRMCNAYEKIEEKYANI